jgi:hypothetical protein
MAYTSYSCCLDGVDEVPEVAASPAPPAWSVPARAVPPPPNANTLRETIFFRKYVKFLMNKYYNVTIKILSKLFPICLE